jgi:hypothetical protein
MMMRRRPIRFWQHHRRIPPPPVADNSDWLNARMLIKSSTSLLEMGTPIMLMVATASAAACRLSKAHDAANTYAGIG